MKHTKNYELNLPEQEDFYNVEDFNGNMEQVDGALGTLAQGMKELLNLIHPIGSIYTSVDPTSPNSYFGGEWKQVIGRFLYAVDAEAGEEGGSRAVSIQERNMPAHVHGSPVHNHGMQNHVHPISLRTTYEGHHQHAHADANGASTPAVVVRSGMAIGRVRINPGVSNAATARFFVGGVPGVTDTSQSGIEYSGATAAAGHHAHSLNGNTGYPFNNTTAANAASNTASTGSGNALDLPLPPHLKVYMWQRVA
jgi:hypothetical protein